MSALERFLAMADADAYEARQICIAPAEDTAPPSLMAIPVSVFQLATKPTRFQPMKNAANDLGDLKVSAKAVPADGVRRVEGAAYPARWTPADYEKERQRRARQRPPRPTAKAKTKSKKLQELIEA